MSTPGRPPWRPPTTADEAAEQLRRYAPDTEAAGDLVTMTVPGTVAIIAKIRRRGVASVSAARKEQA